MVIRTISSGTDKAKAYEYVDDGKPLCGTTKYIYFSPDKTYVVAFYRDVQDEDTRERLRQIVTTYAGLIFGGQAGDYYRSRYCWPTDIVTDGKKTGIVLPVYPPQYFFKKGLSISRQLVGKVKEARWFTAPEFRNKQSTSRLDDSELADWQSHFQLCVNIARSVKHMHAHGLAHSDLSYHNILTDPVTGAAMITDTDELVVPGHIPPDVTGTPGFVAPEVIASRHLNLTDPNRKLPDQHTDLHALAVMIYMLLLYRHPLSGGKVHDTDPDKQELLAFGDKALFIEHPADNSNRPGRQQLKELDMPWADTGRIPYSVTGPYMKALFDKAFIDGLHSPSLRPSASEWEDALLKTTDLMHPCSNPGCRQQWMVFDNSITPCCPFCGKMQKGSMPVLDFYYQHEPGVWRADNHRLVAYHNRYIFQWHVNRNVLRNELLSAADKLPLGYFTFHNGRWTLVNQKLASLRDLTDNKNIPPGSMTEITNGKRLLFSKEDGGRVAIVTLADHIV